MRKWLFVLAMLLAGVAVTGDYHYRLPFNRCDSVRWIKEFNGAADTVIWTDTTRVDTTIPAAQFDSLGTYHFYLELLYQDESEWVGAQEDYDNTYAASGTGTVISIVATTDTFMTTVQGFVLDVPGNGVSGVKVRASISEPVVYRDYDSSTVLTLRNDTTTDTNGMWVLNLPASDKLFISNPAKDTIWYTIQFSYGGWTSPPQKKLFVPDTTLIKYPTIKF